MGVIVNAAGGTTGVTISNDTITTVAVNHGIWVSGSSNGNSPSSSLTISSNTITVGGRGDGNIRGALDAEALGLDGQQQHHHGHGRGEYGTLRRGFHDGER